MEELLLEHFNSRVKLFTEENKHATPGGVSFIGDSITEAFSVKYSFKDKNVYNRGISGDTTLGVLKRLKASVYDLSPSKVVLLIGTNDIELLNATPEEMFKRIKEIVEKIHEFDSNIKVYIQSIYPINKKINPNSTGSRTNEVIKETNMLLKTVKNTTYLDLWDVLKDREGFLNENYTYDGLHISILGYEVLTQALKPLIF